MLGTNIANQRFGKLMALYPTDRRYCRKIIWSCRCDCGNTIEATASSLISGNTQSCGCLNLDASCGAMLGKHFGRLAVLAPTSKRYFGGIVWSCLCECGKLTEVSTNHLVSEDVQSCGCLGIERGRTANTTHGMSNTKLYKRISAMKRRAVIRNSLIEEFTINDMNNKMKEWGNRCIYCGGHYEHADHLIPLSKGGNHSLANLVPSCGFCNTSKNDRYLGSEWWPKSWEALDAAY